MSPPTGHVLSCKRSSHEGLHVFSGMVVEYHFKFVHHKFFVDDMNECKLEYVKFGKVRLNNHVTLCDSNMLQSAHNGLVFV